MEFRANYSQILKKLTFVADAVSQKNIIPVLKNIHFVVKGNTLQIEATNMQIAKVTTIELISATGEADFTVDGKRIQALVHAIPNCEEIVFQYDGKKLAITGEPAGAKVRLATLGSEQFVPIPERDTPLFLLSGAIISYLLRITETCVEDGSARGLDQVKFIIADGNISAYASEGRMFTNSEAELDGDIPDATFCVPSYAIPFLKNFAKAEGMLEFSETPSQLSFHSGEDRLLMLKLETASPAALIEIVAKTFGDVGTSCVMNRQLLISAIKGALIVLDPTRPMVMLEGVNNILSVSGINDNDDAASFTLPFTKDEVDFEYTYNKIDPTDLSKTVPISTILPTGSFKVGLSGVFLLKSLSLLNSETVTLKFCKSVSNMNPVILTTDDIDEDNPYTTVFIIMPFTMKE
jgi:DNA polymerase III sliding clamp (beta) subunit (PCNA family)